MRDPLYDKLLPHLGHEIRCVYYGTHGTPFNVSVECTDCNEVLTSADNEEMEEPEETLEEYAAGLGFDTQTAKRLLEAHICRWRSDHVGELRIYVPDCDITKIFSGAQADYAKANAGTCICQRRVLVVEETAGPLS